MRQNRQSLGKEGEDTARPGDATPLAALAKPNAATAAMDRVQAAFEARDWAAMRALCASNIEFEDRRRQASLSGGVDWWVTDMQAIAHTRPDARFERHLMGIIGDRVGLERMVWSGQNIADQPEEAPARRDGAVSKGVEYLCLTQVDERGQIGAAIAFDTHDWRAAFAEAVARAFAVDAGHATLRPVYEFFLGFNDHDSARIRAAFADNLVADDRRRAGQGLVEDVDAYVESLVALWRLAPDIGLNAMFELARERYGIVRAIGGVGTFPGGGAFERPMVTVQIVAAGRIKRIELFDPEDVAVAMARFEELRPTVAPGPASQKKGARRSARRAGTRAAPQRTKPN